MHALTRLAVRCISMSANMRPRGCVDIGLVVSFLIVGMLLSAPEAHAQSTGTVVHSVVRAQSSTTNNGGLQAAAATTYDMVPSNYQTAN